VLLSYGVSWIILKISDNIIVIPIGESINLYGVISSNVTKCF